MRELNKFEELVPLQQYLEIIANIPSIEDLSPTWATALAQAATTADDDPEAVMADIEKEDKSMKNVVQMLQQHLISGSMESNTLLSQKIIEIYMNGEDVLANILSNKKATKLALLTIL